MCRWAHGSSKSIDDPENNKSYLRSVNICEFSATSALGSGRASITSLMRMQKLPGALVPNTPLKASRNAVASNPTATATPKPKVPKALVTGELFPLLFGACPRWHCPHQPSPTSFRPAFSSLDRET